VAVCWQCVADCCSVLHCAAVCCGRNHLCCANDARTSRRALQCVGSVSAEFCSVLQCVAVCCSVLQCVAEGINCVQQKMPEGAAVCCRVLAMCCSVLVVCCSVLQCVAEESTRVQQR